MAKQFGVSDQALQGLNNIDTFPFPPDEKAALRFADAMTREAGRVDDGLFDELRRHFSEPQIIEIASVIGTFNYFNRVNNALAMDITLTDPEVLALRIAEALATAPPDPAAACDRVVELLRQGRRYGSVGVLARKGDRLVRLAHRGAEPPAAKDATSATLDPDAVTRMGDRELTVPVHFGAELVGVIEIHNDRPGSIDEEDRILVERVAGLLAPLLGARRPPG